MCILIYKPKGVKMPSYDIISRCETNNPDGFGVATPTRLFKTLNKVAFEARLAEIKDEEPCIIHCRWATHGSVKTANCHPFYDESTGLFFAHNGILNITPHADMTDSETAFKYNIVPVVRKFGFDSREEAAEVRSLIGTSKFAIMDKKGHTQLWGQFYKIDGCYYSNLRF